MAALTPVELPGGSPYDVDAFADHVGAPVSRGGHLQAGTTRTSRTMHGAVISVLVPGRPDELVFIAAACEPQRRFLHRLADAASVHRDQRCRRARCTAAFRDADHELAAYWVRVRDYLDDNSAELTFVLDRERQRVHIEPVAMGEVETIGHGNPEGWVNAVLTPSRMTCGEAMTVDWAQGGKWPVVPVEDFSDDLLCPACLAALGEHSVLAFERDWPPTW